MASIFHRTIISILLGFLLVLIIEPLALSRSDAVARTAGRDRSKNIRSATRATKVSRGKTQRGKTTKIKKKPRKAKKKYAPKRRRRTAAAAPRIRSIVADSSVVEELAHGIVHEWMMTEGKHVANVVRIDVKTNARLRSFKALDRYDGLEKVRDIFERADSVLADTVVAAANASFWRAAYNSPIGATVTDGEVIEMPGYRSWSSLMIFEDGSAAIDRIRMRGEVFWRHRRVPVEGINRRIAEEGMVVYNQYYGETVPRGTRKSDSAIVAEVIANEVSAEIGDDTEKPLIDTAGIIAAYRRAQMQEDREYAQVKIACRFLPPRRKRDPAPRPSIGDTMSLVVTQVDTGAVDIPEGGFVFSLGVTEEYFTIARVGDTIRLRYMVDPEQPKRIRDILTGTPRLVRDGVARPEQDIEGSKAVRFVQGALSRTGVGISRNGDTLIVVTINSSNPTESTSGMSLAEFANFMASLGAYQAMNFDGGGSATMVVDGETVSRQRGVPFNRRVSNALIVVKQKIQEKKKPRAPIQPVSP